MKLIPVGGVPIREIDAFVGTSPLKGTVRIGSPELIWVSIGAGPDLEFGAVGVATVLHVQALRERNRFGNLGSVVEGCEYLVAAGNPQLKLGCADGCVSPALLKEPDDAILDNDGGTVGAGGCGNTSV